MSEWSPQVVKIEHVIKHPDADALDIVTVLGDYPVVTKLGEYKVGDLAGYIPVDSVVPDVETYHFLSPRLFETYEENGETKRKDMGPKYQVGSVPESRRAIRAKRFRGIFSMGMLVRAPEGLNLGDSIVEPLSLTKWEEPEEDNVRGANKMRSGKQSSAPDGWEIPYYDVEGLRKYVDCILPDEEIVINEKCHGSNAGFCHDGTKLVVKSRNLYKKEDLDDEWYAAAVRYGMTEKLAKYPMKVFFGELYGKIKGFRYDTVIESGQLNPKLAFFDIYDVATKRFLDYDSFRAILNELDLPAAPELYRGVWLGKEEMYKMAEGLTTLGGKHIREGFVLRSVTNRYEHRLQNRLQLKLVGEGYQLQK